MCDDNKKVFVPYEDLIRRRFTTLAAFGGNHGWCVPDNGQYLEALRATYKVTLI